MSGSHQCVPQTPQVSEFDPCHSLSGYLLQTRISSVHTHHWRSHLGKLPKEICHNCNVSARTSLQEAEMS